MSQQFTRSGIPVQPVYGADGGAERAARLGMPGEFPYTRGIRPAGSWKWIQRELSGEGDPATSNEQLKYLISKGQTGIDVIADAPSNALMDPDHPLSVHAIGTQGVSICCLQDYRELWKGLPLGSLTVSNSLPAIFTAASLYLIAKETGTPAEALRGSVIQSPFYGEPCGYATHMPFQLRLRMSSDCIEFCSKTMPKFHSFVEDTYFFCEAGLNAVEEMALGFVEIRHIVRDLLKRGLAIDSFAPRIAILVDCGMDFFEEIAKIRRRPPALRPDDEGGVRRRWTRGPGRRHHLPHLRALAHRPAALQQHRPRRGAVARARARRRPGAGGLGLRRGVPHPEPRVAPRGAPHPADHQGSRPTSPRSPIPSAARTTWRPSPTSSRSGSGP